MTQNNPAIRKSGGGGLLIRSSSQLVFVDNLARESATQSQDWAWLPAEVLLQVFAFLEGSVEGYRAAGAARLACRNWGALLTPARLSIYPRCNGPIACLGASWKALFPRLQTLNLSRCCNASDSVLAGLAPLTSLTSLSIGGSELITALGVASLRVFGGNLTSLDLSDCRRVGDSAAKELQHLTCLTDLNLSGCRALCDTGVRSLRSLQRLRCLWLGMCYKLTDDAVAELQALPAVEELQLSFCRRISDNGLQQLKALKRLRVLDISACQIQADGLRALPSKLERLTMWQCSTMDDTGISALACSSSLLSLNCSSCAITDAGLAVLGQFLRLHTLNLSVCNSITDAGLASLKHLELRSFGVPYCNVTDQGLRSLVDAHSATLASLSIRGCPAVEDSTVAILAEKGPNLTDLNLASCGAITDVGIASLHGLSQLTALNLQYCDRVTDEAIAGLVAALPSLVQLNTDTLCENNLKRNTGTRLFRRPTMAQAGQMHPAAGGAWALPVASMPIDCSMTSSKAGCVGRQYPGQRTVEAVELQLG
eukprot:CAMPEP_0117664734 /NCGR_PEP_ID=MMETSP0804-20121206/9394_1 /TAXON_ID=1074897 /ORGANISM="Tetraselmis astigmatica, Strain CCMP880" /LENGTH=538 /DNA_ID=CAMNT_0005472019 /DNA_START=716 /DNA_END=2331 /DNA_ORIENTATION=+